MPGEEHDRRAGHTSGGQQLGASVATQLPGRQTGQQDRHAGRDRGWQTQHRERARRNRAHRTSDQRGQWPLICIAPVQVPTGRHEVELVAVIPVPRGEGHQHHRHQPGDDQHASGHPRPDAFQRPGRRAIDLGVRHHSCAHPPRVRTVGHRTSGERSISVGSSLQTVRSPGRTCGRAAEGAAAAWRARTTPSVGRATPATRQQGRRS